MFFILHASKQCFDRPLCVTESGNNQPGMRMANKTDVFTGLIVIAVSLFGYWGTTFTSNVAGTTDPVGPVAFARWCVCFLFVCGVAQTIVGLRDKTSPKYWADGATTKKLWMFAALICGYVFMAMWVGDLIDCIGLEDMPTGAGFTAASFVYLAASLWACGRRNPVEIGLVAFFMPASVAYTFVEFFQIVLP